MEIDFHQMSIAEVIDKYPSKMKQEWDMMPGPGHQYHSQIIIPQWVEDDFNRLKTETRYFCASNSPIQFDCTQGVGTNEESFATAPHATYGFSKMNTAYHRYISTAPKHKIDRWMHDIAQTNFRLSSYKIKVNSQPSGQVVAEHFDSLTTWRRENDEEAHSRRFVDVKRYILFISPQAVGHFVSTTSGAINWEQGDVYSLSWYAKCATGNASSKSKILVQFEGFETTCG